MKKLLFVAFILSMITACTKEYKNAKVVRDCTGTYLQISSKDYHVCNIEKTNSYKDDETVKATFSSVGECKGSAANQAVCLMYHENEGWIEVKSIKR